ncbi:hypothetical protein Hanom_Chr11g01041101 [Helianthus anomalus]
MTSCNLTTVSTRHSFNVSFVRYTSYVEFGSYDDLMQLDNGFYTSLVQLQETKQIDENPCPYLPRLSSMSLTFDVHNISSSGQSTVSQSALQP